MISELTQFFMNTWERHGAVLHTNSSTPSLEKLQPSKAIQVGASYTCRYISYLKEQNDDISEYLGGEHLADVGLSFYGASSQILRIINQHSKDISSHKNQDHVERTLDPAEPLRTNKNDENSSSDYSDNVEKGDHRFQDELCRFCSAKTSFLSGSINASEISFGESHIIVDKSDNHDDPPIGSEHDCTKKRFPLGVTSSETVNTIDDSSFSRQSSSLQATVTTTMFEESENYVTPKMATKSEVQNKVGHRSDAGYTVDTGLVLPSNSAKRSIVNSGVVPPALYPTGPPVPFLAMLQTCNFPSQGSCNGGVYGEFDREALICDNAAFNGNANPGGICDHHMGRVSASTVGSKWSQTPALPNVPRGWHSQNIPFIGHSAYPYPIAVPMVAQHFQDTIPLGCPARSSLLQGSQFVPATDIWLETQIRTSHMLTFGDGVSNCHGAIRTCPTSSRVAPRVQSRSISHRWNHNHEGDSLDKRQQNPIDRSAHVFSLTDDERSHSNKPSTVTGGSGPNCRQTIVLDLYKQKKISSCLGENSSIGSSSLSRVSAYMIQENEPSQLLTVGSSSSSSQLQRWMAQKNYQLKEEDFPPL